MDWVQRCLRKTVWPEWLGTLSTVLGNTGRAARLPTDALLQGLALAAQGLVENKGRIGAH